MFEENGWDTWLKNTYSTNTTGVPETYDQLIALCDKIIEKPVAVPGDPDGTAAVKPFIMLVLIQTTSTIPFLTGGAKLLEKKQLKIS